MNTTNLEILDWSYALQIVLEQMSEEEFEKYMEGKAIRLNGKLYGLKKEIQ